MFRTAKWKALLPAIFFVIQATAQINSPYSRFGLGDVHNPRNVVNRGMGNVAAAMTDYQAVNFVNPASYSHLQTVTFDVGIEMEMRTLMSADKKTQHQSTYLMFNYMAIGVPLAKGKDNLTKWGLAFGLRPFTRVGYNVSEAGRLQGIDSINTNYQGTGGGYRAFLGTGLKIGQLSIGFNAGFLFGQKDLSSQRFFINDSTFYFNSSLETRTSYSKFVLDGGLQYTIKLNKETTARIGANGFLGNSVNAKQYRFRQTFIASAPSVIDTIDVVQRTNTIEGTIELPLGFTTGIAVEKEGKWLLSAEYESVKWSNYRFLGDIDPLGNTSMLRFGGYFIPGVNDAKKYFNRVVYRAGFYTGKDMIVVEGNQLPIWGATMGFGLPIRRYSAFSNQFSTINLAFEYGRRGTTAVQLSERFFKLNVGISLGDLWFMKRKFD